MKKKILVAVIGATIVAISVVMIILSGNPRIVSQGEHYLLKNALFSTGLDNSLHISSNNFDVVIYDQDNDKKLSGELDFMKITINKKSKVYLFPMKSDKVLTNVKSDLDNQSNSEITSAPEEYVFSEEAMAFGEVLIKFSTERKNTIQSWNFDDNEPIKAIGGEWIFALLAGLSILCCAFLFEWGNPTSSLSVEVTK